MKIILRLIFLETLPDRNWMHRTEDKEIDIPDVVPFQLPRSIIHNGIVFSPEAMDFNGDIAVAPYRETGKPTVWDSFEAPCVHGFHA